MADLKKLLALKGVFAAGTFSDDGKLTSYAGEITEDEAAMAAAMCAANMHMARMQADGYTALSGESGWTPATGFAVAGPRYAVCVMGNAGVFARIGECSFNEIYKALSNFSKT
jgi:roadblock/LC7 domain-containing protein